MEQTAQIKECAHTVAGIVAHVDAGKTTLAESMLYLTGGTRKLGRVDHKDAFLDTYELEKNKMCIRDSFRVVHLFLRHLTRMTVMQERLPWCVSGRSNKLKNSGRKA